MRIKIFFFTLITLNIFSIEIYSQNIFNNKKTKEVVKIDEFTKKTKGCEAYNGLFNIYQNKKDGKAYIEIDTSHLDKEFIYFSYFENGVLEAGSVKGRFRGSKIIKINKFYENIDITIENTKYFFDKENPLSRGAKTNINTPIIISEKIIAKDASKTKFLINADNLFLTEAFQQVKSSYYPGYKGYRLGNLSKTKTRYTKIRNYPKNTDIVVNYVYESKYPSKRGSSAMTDARSVSVIVQHSLIQLPKNNYKPRIDDPRVGFFTTQSDNMTTTDRTNYRDFINRWNLVKKDSTKPISEPKEPIVWWIENTTPHELREIIKDGVETWNLAFEKAGFKNAVRVKVQPDTADWDAGDIRYNVLRWTSSPAPPWGGYGPSFVNPRTGQILGADIMLEWTYITRRIYEDELFNNNELHNHHNCVAGLHQQIETDFGLNYIKNYGLGEDMEKELVKQSLYRLVLHEVGHTLGLSHNFKGSTLLSTSELNNKNIVNRRGVCNSVMEYPAINIAKDPENQGLYFDIKPGVYDIWAIQYGYSSYNSDTEETEGLEKILSRSTEDQLAFANDALDMRSPGKGTDPDAMIYDLSSNPMDHSIDKINMIVNILKELKDNYTSDNDTYEELYRAYRTLVYSYYQCLNIVSRQIGGVHIDLSKTTQKTDKKPFKSVSEKDQKKAMDILNKYAFSNNFLLQPDLFPYLQSQRRGFKVSEDPSIHQRILTYQNRLLDQLLHPNVLQRITNSSLYGNKYTLTTYMIDLRNSLFKDDFNSNISTIRQNIQISYVNRLISIVGNKSKYDNVSKSAAYYNLNWLKNNINISSGNLSSRQHKQYIIYLINQLENN